MFLIRCYGKVIAPIKYMTNLQWTPALFNVLYFISPLMWRVWLQHIGNKLTSSPREMPPTFSKILPASPSPQLRILEELYYYPYFTAKTNVQFTRLRAAAWSNRVVVVVYFFFVSFFFFRSLSLSLRLIYFFPKVYEIKRFLIFHKLTFQR